MATEDRLATLRPGTADPEGMQPDAAAAELADLAAAIAFHDARYHGEDRRSSAMRTMTRW